MSASQKLLRHLTSLTHADPAGELTTIPPTVESETAAKTLRRLVEPSDGSSSGSATATAKREQELDALLEPSSGNASTLCAAITCATSAIDLIERDEAADTAACGLLRWGHLRVNALQILLQLASSEARCVALLEATSDAAAATCVSLLASKASRTDREGVRTAANLLRNLAMPAASRPRLGAELSGLFPALIKHVPHPDPNTEAVVGAALRILVEGCQPNALKAALAASTGVVSGGGDGSLLEEGAGGSSSGSSSSSGTIAIAGSSSNGGGGAFVGFGRLIGVDLSKMHPFCRVELSRFIAICIGSVCASDGDGGSEQQHAAALASPEALGFAAFVLGSRHPGLHAEFCAALKAARKAQADADVADWVEKVAAFKVGVQGREMTIKAVLAELAAAGSVNKEAAALLEAPLAEVS